MCLYNGVLAQKNKYLCVGINPTLHTNSTIKTKLGSEYVKGVPTIGYGGSIFYQGYIREHIGFSTGFTYSSHKKKFKISVPIGDFAEEYAYRGNYKFSFEPDVMNKYVDYFIGIFYCSNLTNSSSMQIGIDLCMKFNAFKIRELYQREYYENPKDMVDTSMFVNIYGSLGVNQRRRTVFEYLALMIPQYRIHASYNYNLSESSLLYSSLSYERIMPFGGGETGLYPITFETNDMNLNKISRTDYFNKFDMFRLQIGVRYRLNNKQLKHIY